MGCVYLATSPSGKVYVGLTSQSFAQRRRSHEWEASRGSSVPFHRAIRKHGEGMTWSILHDNVESVEELMLLEVAEIASRGAFGPRGYNCTTGGDSGFRLNEDIKENLRIKAREQWSTPESRVELSRAIKKAWAEHPEWFDGAWSEETREKRAKTMARVFRDPVYLERLSDGVRKSWENLTPEQRKARGNNISASLKGRKGPSQSPERRAVTSAMNVRTWKDPEVRRKRAEGISRALSGRGNACIIEGERFGNVRLAGERFGLHGATVAYRISKPRWPEWRYDD